MWNKKAPKLGAFLFVTVYSPSLKPMHKINWKFNDKGDFNLQGFAHMHPVQHGVYVGIPVCRCGNPISPAFQQPIPFQGSLPTSNLLIKDYGDAPYTVNINEAAKQNNTYRTALWTGEHLQVTLMSIDVGDDIGLEIHHNNDQFLRIEEGQGIVQMGKNPEHLDFVRQVGDDSAIMVPANTWHNVTNTGHTPLKLYSIYAPPHHPKGTVHQTKAIALEEEGLH